MDVQLNDTLPALLTFDSQRVQIGHIGANYSANLGAQFLEYNLSNLAPGETWLIYVNATVDYYPDECEVTTNEIIAKGIPLNGDEVYSTHELNVTVCEANASVIKIDQTFFLASQGGVVTFNVTFTNNGNVTLDTVRVTDTLPNGLTFLEATIAPDETDPEVWNLGPMAVGDTTTIIINATVDYVPDGCVNITNDVLVEGMPANGDNVTPSDDMTFMICEAGIEVIKTVEDSTIYKNDETTFTIVVRNAGFKNISNVTLLDVLPDGLEFVATNLTPNTTAPLYWNNLSNLSIGEERTITLTVKATSKGTKVNTATAEGSVINGDNVTGIGTATVTVKDKSSKHACGGGGGFVAMVQPINKTEEEEPEEELGEGEPTEVEPVTGPTEEPPAEPGEEAPEQELPSGPVAGAATARPGQEPGFDLERMLNDLWDALKDLADDVWDFLMELPMWAWVVIAAVLAGLIALGALKKKDVI